MTPSAIVGDIEDVFDPLSEGRDLGAIELEGFGSWTLKAEARARGAEADECYLVGWREPMPPVPDIAIEVI